MKIQSANEFGEARKKSLQLCNEWRRCPTCVKKVGELYREYKEKLKVRRSFKKKEERKKMARKMEEKGFKVKIVPPSKEYTLKILDMGYRAYVNLGPTSFMSISQDGRVNINEGVLKSLGLTVSVVK